MNRTWISLAIVVAAWALPITAEGNTKITRLVTISPNLFAAGETASLFACVSNGNPDSTAHLVNGDTFTFTIDAMAGTVTSPGTIRIDSANNVLLTTDFIATSSANTLTIRYQNTTSKQFNAGDTFCLEAPLNVSTTIGPFEVVGAGPNDVARYNPDVPSFFIAAIVTFPVGDITAVDTPVGSGLTGGATSGNVTLSIAPTYQLPQACSTGQVAKWNGTAWTCAADDNSGGDITAVSPGAGLTGGGLSGDVTLSVATGGITGAMIGAGQVVKSLNGLTDGVMLAAGANTSVTADPTTNTITVASTAGGLGGGGTINTVPKFTAATTLGDSVISEVGGKVGIGTTVPDAGLTVLSNGTPVTIDGIAYNQMASFRPPATQYGVGILGGTFADGVVILATAQQSSLHFATVLSPNYFRRMTITAVGNVGIGTTAPTSRLHVVGDITATGAKNFQITHPVEPDRKLLVHSALEGPEAAVYYRGEAQLVNGKVVVTLPSYFEALTRKDQRTVQLTPIGGFAPLYVVDDVREGRFTVRTEEGNQALRFYWEVKAVRADIPALVVEKLKGNE